jgi:uncharacterized Ntn-hydrolase superfamily protein
MTYSIVARDRETGALGIGVQSHYFGAGRVVPWAEAGVGAVATQSVVEVSYGPKGLDLMRAGATASDALAQLVAADPLAVVRQVAMVDAAGATATHTGAGCVAQAGDRATDQVTAQANMMERATVWDAMISAYQGAVGQDLAGRILAALEAAEAEGGDVRGKQSAAILVVSGERSDTPWDERLVDLRVDDSDAPLPELRRLVELNRAFARMSGVLFSGLPFAPEIDPSAPELEHALAELTAVQAAVGDNREPTIWAAVLLAKAGRADEARKQLAFATETNARWTTFLAALPAAGVLPPDSPLLQGP